MHLLFFFRNCEENQALWTALNLSQIIDLGDLLNVSKVSFLATLSNK